MQGRRIAMPSQRFCNLSEEKKKNIRDAAIDEFSRAPLESVSINRIISDAGISRGSFYTYFEDKRELLEWLFSDIREKQEEFIRESMIKAEGDYFKACEMSLEKLVSFFIENDIFKFVRSMLEQGMISLPLDFKSVRSCDDQGNELVHWIRENVDRKELNIKDESELKSLLMLTQMTVMITVFHYFLLKNEGKDTEEAYDFYRNTINILKNGACAR